MSRASSPHDEYSFIEVGLPLSVTLDWENSNYMHLEIVNSHGEDIETVDLGSDESGI